MVIERKCTNSDILVYSHCICKVVCLDFRGHRADIYELVFLPRQITIHLEVYVEQRVGKSYIVVKPQFTPP